MPTLSRRIAVIAWTCLFGCAGAPSPAPAPAQPPVPALAPAAPSLTPAPTSAAAENPAQAQFRELLATLGVKYLPGERQLEVSGWVNMQKGLVEVFACAPGGKTHESVVVLDCVPSGIHAGLLALGLKPGTPVEEGTEADYKPPTGDGVDIHVRFASTGRVEECRAEDWVWNQKAGIPMQRGAWVFAGSFMQSVTSDAEDATFAANYVKSIATTYHDATAILENPNAEGKDDTVYYANERAVPAVGTPVTVIFSAAAKTR